MGQVKSIGDVSWSRAEMTESLREFSELYAQRPIADNAGGMQAPPMFLVWFALRKLNPRAIIESGVWYGQGTWFFEKACPDAQLYCIDPCMSRIRYRSERARYHEQDFLVIDWSTLPKNETVLFFDDHQDALERVKQALRLGFKHLMFEDNYPPSQGDCYSLKQAFMCDSDHARYLECTLKTYYEFPPIFKSEYTRWGDLWGEEQYPTPEPLLRSVGESHQQIYHDEADTYTWMCYASLRRS